MGSLFPVLIFVVSNGAFLYRASDSFRAWLKTFEALTQQATLVTLILAVMVVSAYVLSGISSVLLEILEGKHWPVSWFNRLSYRFQRMRLRSLKKAYWDCFLAFDAVKFGLEGDPSKSIPGWVEKLDNSKKALAAAAIRPTPSPYPTNAWQRLTYRCRPSFPKPVISAMLKIRGCREAGLPIPASLLEAAVDGLAPVLSSGTDSSESMSTLSEDCDYLIESIYFSRDRYQAERIRLFNLRRFFYPVDLDADKEQSAIILAPTRMGNIGRTMRSYAQKHYGFDLDVLWTRLQNASQSSDKFYTILQDAKVQLDFFVATTWFAAITTLTWCVLQVAVFRVAIDFVYTAVAGPIIILIAYRLSCRSYGIFADLMRSCVDLFRFKVLTDLHLPLPLGLEEEKKAWQDLANVMGYENLRGDGGRPISVTYKH
ncbi:hypothetical protein [Granulicella sp. WH15]|uniref:hypothetical protein n=1 Tax=Granulicella sp. WH15 TaxID=2602070 RepID=UPI0013A5B518|nr:hypothetical protein [Granulicella sp. WH15]